MDEPQPEPQSDSQPKVHFKKSSSIKNWGKYVFEFLMLFLAVTLGFFVDNMRGEIADRNLERQHMRSLFADLQQDTTLFRNQVRELKDVTKICDSVILLAGKSQFSTHDLQRLYFLTRRMNPRIAPIFVNDRAYDEMRSSGALRLIHSRNIADSISLYYFTTKELLWLNGLVLDRAQRKNEMEAKLFRATTFDSMVNKSTLAFKPPTGKPKLATYNQMDINEFAMSIHFISSVCIYRKNRIGVLSQHARRLLKTLSKEYPELK